MPTAEDLQNQLDRIYDAYQRQVKRIEDQLEMLAQYPEDVFEDDDVITFNYKFAGSPRVYSYAALKAQGLWYTTGPRSPKAYTWNELMSWWNAGTVSNLAYVTEVEELM